MTSSRIHSPIKLLMYCLVVLLLWAGNGVVHAAKEADSKTADTTEQATDAKESKDAQATDGEQSQNPEDASTGEDAEPSASSKIENSMANIELIQGTLEALSREIENSKESANLNRSSVQTIKDGLNQIDSKLKEAYAGLDESRSSITSNTTDIEKLKQDTLSLLRDVRANASDLGVQKTLVEDNSVRLYELLIKITDINDRMDKFVKGIKDADPSKDLQKTFSRDLSRLWILLSVVLVLFAPLAIIISSNSSQRKPLSDGTGQQQGMVLASLGVFLGYFILGFSLMYGPSVSGWFGFMNYLFEGSEAVAKLNPAFNFAEFVMYQIGFIMLAALIVYIAVGHCFSSTAHMLLALLIGAVVIPVFGHWTWASYFIPGNKGWLEAIGFVDQAGSTTINSVAAWFALILVWKLGKKQPKTDDGEAADEPVYSSTTTQFLWISWLGMTTGTLPISSEQISNVMLNVGLAASAGGLAAFMHYVFFHSDQGKIARGLGGFVSGLVAIAASAQSVTFAEAAAIGASAGFIQNLAFSALRHTLLKQNWQIQAAYLVAIHGVAGAWGTLCYALLGTEGNFSLPDWFQLVTQFQGVLAALGYGIILANIVTPLFNIKLLKTAAPQG